MPWRDVMRESAGLDLYTFTLDTAKYYITLRIDGVVLGGGRGGHIVDPAFFAN